MLRCLGALAAVSGAAAAALLERERGRRSGLQVRMPRRPGDKLFRLCCRRALRSCCAAAQSAACRPAADSGISASRAVLACALWEPPLCDAAGAQAHAAARLGALQDMTWR